MALLAFWFTKVDTLDALFWAGRIIFGGQVVPISFLPGIFKTLAYALPFRYMFSFPLEIYFNKLDSLQLISGLIMQIIWIMIFLLSYKVLFSRGVKAYESYGN